jgi:hypothetical protein
MGDFSGNSFEVIHGYVDIDGVGDCTFKCTDTLNVQIDGIGNVRYYGNPVVSSDIDGLGNVQRRN